MLNLPTLLLCSCLVLFVTSAPLAAVELPKCNIGESLVAFALCKPMIDNLNGYIKEEKGKITSQEGIKNMTLACVKTSKCLAPLQCQEAQKLKKSFDNACDLLHYSNTDTHSCIKELFKNAYYAQTSNETSCLRENAFLERDLKKRHDAYIKGESCFLKHAKLNCKNSTFDYFSQNYKSFADTISIKPEGDNCKDPHHQLNALHCKALNNEIQVNFNKFRKLEVQPNDPQVIAMIKLCKDTQFCMNDSCAFTDSVRSQVADGCDMLGMMHSHFTNCMLKMKAEKPDFSKYKCLEGINFHDTSKTVACEKLDKKKECAKTIMSDFCGKEAIEDFDKFAVVLKKQFNCK